jgi:hypothetical protein
VQQLDWDPEQLVRDCIKDTGFECAKACAERGWSNLMRAVVKPMLPEELYQAPLEDLLADDLAAGVQEQGREHPSVLRDSGSEAGGVMPVEEQENNPGAQVTFEVGDE